MTSNHHDSAAPSASRRGLARWPLFLIGSPAAVAVWSGWVGLGGLCGFGVIHPLPGIAGGFHLDTAITLPVGVEAYGAYALGAWLTPGTPDQARRFARRSAIGALALGMCGQVIYHLLAAAHAARAPWLVVMLVSCIPVITLGFGAALTHLLKAGPGPDAAPAVTPGPGGLREDGGSAAAAGAQIAAGRAARTEIQRAAMDGSTAPVRPLPQPGARTGLSPAADRDAVVAALADEIREAIAAGDRWRPDYDALMKATGYRKSWCEKAVRDARMALLDPPPYGHTDPSPPDDAAAARTDGAAPADGHTDDRLALAAANGHVP